MISTFILLSKKPPESLPKSQLVWQPVTCEMRRMLNSDFPYSLHSYYSKSVSNVSITVFVYKYGDFDVTDEETEVARIPALR